MKNTKINELEKRIIALEKLVLKPSKNTRRSKPKLDQLTVDLDNLMKIHRERFSGGVIFSGLALPSDNPNRLIRWSSSGGFKTPNDTDKFIDLATAEDISAFCSNFSSPEKMKIIRELIKDGPLSQKEILHQTKISQGQFYHHVKDMISNKLVEKPKKDFYDLSEMGHVLSVSFIGLINTFLK
ncbi:MAG: winged helix-turn-helix domain-containing protein [bacterium]